MKLPDFIGAGAIAIGIASALALIIVAGGWFFAALILFALELAARDLEGAANEHRRGEM